MQSHLRGLLINKLDKNDQKYVKIEVFLNFWTSGNKAFIKNNMYYLNKNRINLVQL